MKYLGQLRFKFTSIIVRVLVNRAQIHEPAFMSFFNGVFFCIVKLVIYCLKLRQSNHFNDQLIGLSLSSWCCRQV